MKEDRDTLVRATILHAEARVAVVRTTAAVNQAIGMHALSPVAAAALGRALTIGAYLSASLTEAGQRFNLIVDGSGPLGKICVAGEAGGRIRGFVENPTVDLPTRNGKWDVGGAVGREGELTVIKDLGLREPYVGKCRLVSGELGEDFAAYLRQSEGVANAVALGVLTDQTGCAAAGGIFIEALPGASEDTLVILEDVLQAVQHVSRQFVGKTASEVAAFYFGHLDAQLFEPMPITLHCACAQKIPGVLRSLGRQECDAILAQQGVVEVKCDYCAKAYRYDAAALDALFGGKA